MSGIELPDSLKPWHAWLNGFTPELAMELGGLVQRMQPLLGRFQGHTQGGVPEFEGLDDLRRRGPYERLLATEWLLADEVPDEFLRRAAASEHLFLAPRPRAREAEKLIVAIFDAGPQQLGAPRLGQMALWILLARRAAQMGGALRWGVLQVPGHLHDANDAGQLKKLLSSRSFTASHAGHQDEWKASLGNLKDAPGECWLIGAEAAQRTPNNKTWTHRVCLRRAVLGDALEASFSDRSGQRTTRLALPVPEFAAPLLKGAFGGEGVTAMSRPHKGQLSLQRAPVISADGVYVAVQLLGEFGAAVFRVSTTKDGRQAGTRYPQWPENGQPLGAAFAGKQFGALISVKNELRFWQLPISAACAMPAPEQFNAPPGLAQWLPTAYLKKGKDARLCVLDHAGRLVVFDRSTDPGYLAKVAKPFVVEKKALALLQWRDDSAVFAMHDDGIVWLGRLTVTGTPSSVRPICAKPDDAPRVFFAGRQHWNLNVGACAVRMVEGPQEVWCMNVPLSEGKQASTRAKDFESFELTLQLGWTGIGLLCDDRHGRFSLLAQSPNRVHFVLHHRDGVEPVYTAPERVEKCTVCPATGLLAMLTTQRRLILYSVPNRALRAVLQGDGVVPDA